MDHLLIIEDDTDIRESLQDMLELVGYEVSVACDGREGFDSILETSPDLVLCDVNMPKLDGFELLAAINQRLKDEIIPTFIFITAKVEQQDIRQGMGLGADDYILKPFNHSDLLEIIRLRLDKRKKMLDVKTSNATEQPVGEAFNKLILPCVDGFEFVAFDDILKCEADRSYCTFYLKDGRTIVVSKSMKEFEPILSKEHFFKVHKSTIVNLNFVEKYVRGKGGYLLLSDGSSVAVAVRKKDSLMKLLRRKD